MTVVRDLVTAGSDITLKNSVDTSVVSVLHERMNNFEVNTGLQAFNLYDDSHAVAAL